MGETLPEIKRKRIRILNCPVDTFRAEEYVEIIGENVKNKIPVTYSDVDAGKLAMMQRNKNVFENVTRSDLINCEGQWLIWLSKLLKNKIPERVTGVELFEKLIAYAAENGLGVYLFGAGEEVIQKTAGIFAGRHGSEVIAGYRNGYFDKKESAGIAAEIAKSKADMLFVGIKSPEKENFLYENREILKNIPFRMGVGGSFDVVSGYIKRAPLWVQKISMEWFYRFLQEPGKKWKIEVVDSFLFLLYMAGYLGRFKWPMRSETE